MDGADSRNDLTSEELAEVIQEIRERVRARHPAFSADGLPLPDLMPLFHARDAAAGKVAAIGTVNPRPPGFINRVVQAAKHLIARFLDWHVREQIEFNRAVLCAIESILETFNENNRALARLARTGAELRVKIGDICDAVERRLGVLEDTARRLDQGLNNASEQARLLGDEARELKDVRLHWAQWRQEWERKLAINEVQFLRSVADLQGAFQHRVTLMDTSFREMVKSQHADFTATLKSTGLEIQQRLWADLEKIREEFERLIHTELRLIRLRSGLITGGVVTPTLGSDRELGGRLDLSRFAERFRGPEEFVRRKQEFYLPFFKGCRAVLDLGCGRGEFLALLKREGIEARGVDANPEAVEQCRSAGFAVECAELSAYLRDLPDDVLDGIFCAHVVEHLPPGLLPEVIGLAAQKLSKGGVIAMETPNPECLAIFSSHFYLDPTHTRPVPPALLRLYMEEAGFGRIEMYPLSPAQESMPSVGSLPEDFRKAFFGALDYAMIARKL